MDINTSDIFIIGGGINGVGIAADAQGRGLSVTLCEQGDLGCATSSASSKLIHGGLRYLERCEFSLVRKSLIEREVLLKKAPHLIQPLEFVLPHEHHLRSRWIIKLGLMFYDHLAKRKNLPRSRSFYFKKNLREYGLQNKFEYGFSYFDCKVDDARLVISNALQARELGANILTKTLFISAEFKNNLWKIKLKNYQNNQIFYYYAKVLLNVAGPWVTEVQKKISASFSIKTSLIKGSHIVVPKIYQGDFAYLLQNSDQRIIFAIPYQKDFTLIGTTDVKFNNHPTAIEIKKNEINYLCKVINHYFEKKIAPNDLIWSYSGVRCLLYEDKDPYAITREYSIKTSDTLPLVTVIGGKITTYRKLAEEVVERLKMFFPHIPKAWTANYPLPGGDIVNCDIQKFIGKVKQQFPWLKESLLIRYINSYGTRLYLILENISSYEELGILFGADLYEVEVMYLIHKEWAKTSEDILWRRTKLGLWFSETQRQSLERYVSRECAQILDRSPPTRG